MSNQQQLRLSFLHVFFTLSSASPLPVRLLRRDMGAGQKAGLGIGIAVAIILVALIVTFFVVHLRRPKPNTSIAAPNTPSTEKSPYGFKSGNKSAFTATNEVTETGAPRRNKSVKDRLMGPLYRGSVIDPLPPPTKVRLGDRSTNRASTLTMNNSRDSMISKPWTGSDNNSPRNSFSSKRATRMMMMM